MGSKDRQSAKKISAEIAGRIEALALGYAPGEILDERSLCKGFGCAQNTLRRALEMLSGTHVLEPNRQWKVRDGASRLAKACLADIEVGDESETRELLELRKTLEGLAARRAAAIYSKTASYALDLRATQKALLLARGNVDEEVRVDRHFHRQIYLLAGSRLLEELLRALRESLSRNIEANVRALYDKPGYARDNLHYHQHIYGAIAANDADRAELIATGHIQFAMDWLRGVRGATASEVLRAGRVIVRAGRA